MNLNNLFYVFSLVYVIVLVDSNKAKSQRSKGCKCRKWYKQLSTNLDSKFKSLEKNLMLHMSAPDRVLNSTGSYRDLDTKMGRLREVIQTKNALNSETETLQRLKDQIRAQKKSMDNLNNHFGLLENIVRNLTQVIGRLGNLAPSIAIQHVATTMLTTTAPIKTIAPEVLKTTSAPTRAFPRHCHDVYKHGGLRFQGDYYIMLQPEKTKKPFKVVCKPIDNTGGWTVIQRRQDGSVDFYRNWQDYKTGFGDLSGEFWMGNDKIYELTNQGPFQLRIDMEDFNGKKYYAVYNYFRIDNESENYKLHVRGYSGNSGDSMTSVRDNHNGNMFSTHDRDNDRRGYNNCARHYRGGWWYSDCYDSNLNGQYYPQGRHINFFNRDGIHWNSINMHSSLKSVEMSVRPADDISSENNV
ncbi:ficolin-1-like [Ostrea edulis]|uniref:ficolin-1-like n=1 Tax=Ostrea edulis TaxID=37623 RepID=UPI00209600C9|nr:ficolin-1-like [Ostrea edulis]